MIGERRTQLWCARLAWPRIRVVMSAMGKALPPVVACLDITLRSLDGVPTYALTDNQNRISPQDLVTVIAAR